MITLTREEKISHAIKQAHLKCAYDSKYPDICVMKWSNPKPVFVLKNARRIEDITGIKKKTIIMQCLRYRKTLKPTSRRFHKYWFCYKQDYDKAQIHNKLGYPQETKQKIINILQGIEGVINRFGGVLVETLINKGTITSIIEVSKAR